MNEKEWDLRCDIAERQHDDLHCTMSQCGSAFSNHIIWRESLFAKFVPADTAIGHPGALWENRSMDIFRSVEYRP